MSRLWMSGAAAVMALSIAGVQAQTTGSQDPQPQQPQQTQAATADNSDAQGTTTVRGCVYKEKDVPGRTPNVAEQAGILEDYILVASHDSASASGTAATGTTGSAATGTATAGTSGTMSAHGGAKAYKLEKIADEQLRSVVGKMVEVTGKVDAEHGDKAGAAASATNPAGAPTGTSGTAGAPAQDRNLGPDSIELPEFEVTSIREVEGTCPATPDIRK